MFSIETERALKRAVCIGKIGQAPLGAGAHGRYYPYYYGGHYYRYRYQGHYYRYHNGGHYYRHRSGLSVSMGGQGITAIGKRITVRTALTIL